MINQSVVSEKKRSITGPSTARKKFANYLTQPVVRLLIQTPVTPNAITWSGLLVTLGAAALIVTGHLFAAGFVVLSAGFLDVLDGALARSTNRTTRFGAILDASVDRLSEAILLLGILFLFAREQSMLGILVVGVTLPASMLVSYVRAKAEAAGLECQVGFFTRAERVMVLALGLLLNQLLITLAVIAVLSLVTVGQRLISVWQQGEKSDSF